ncbi:MAG: SDR family NAD(P)-dependent oxidoreductase, partial [Pseudomonadota bacterium]
MTGTRFKDRIALITGASRGIGRATAKLLAAEGAHVLLIGRNQKTLEAVDDEITSSGGHATLIPLDLADGAAIDPLG